MRFAFCNEGFGDRPWRDQCAAISQAGYDAVEIAPYTLAEDVRDLSASARREIRGAAQDAGLRVTGLHWLLVKPDGLHISHPDSAVRARTADYLRQLADFCGDLGGAVMVFGSPRQRGGSAGAGEQDAWRWAIETFTGVLPTLAARDLTLCLEPLTTAETDFILSAADGRRMVEAIGHPSFRLLLDVKAMVSERDPIPALIRKHADILGHFHANDANLQAPGCGETDFRPILAALHDVGYSGYVSAEPFKFTTDIDTIVQQSLRYLKSCLPDRASPEEVTRRSSQKAQDIG